MASEKTPKVNVVDEEEEDDEDVAMRQAREDDDDDGHIVLVPLRDERGQTVATTVKYIPGEQMRRINALIKASNDRKRAK